MYDVKQVVKNLKNLTKTTSNKQLAEQINVKFDTISAWLKRGTIGSSFDPICVYCIKNNFSLDFVFGLSSPSALKQKLNFFTLRSLVTFYIALKNFDQLLSAKDVVDFVFILKNNIKPIQIDFKEDRFALWFDQKNLIVEIQTNFTDEDILFIVDNKDQILHEIDEVISKKENFISKWFNFRYITKKIF